MHIVLKLKIYNFMVKDPIIPIILCGGSGSRLWPLSRRSFPKQFISLIDDKGKTLLQQTQERLSAIKNIQEPIYICNEEHRFIVAEQLREINISPWKILLEPFGRNTSAAISLGSILALDEYENPNLLILSADHNIKNTKKFIKKIHDGLKYSEEGRLVTFGVIPDFPETGYGYIESEKPLNVDNNLGENITRFIEKPDKESAEKLVKDKRFTWNSGIFLFKAKTIINEIDKFAPQINQYCRESLKNSEQDLDFQRVNKSFFSKCPNISIDISVMEKTKLGTVIPLDVGWSDIGSWESVWKLSKKDLNGNSLKGNVVTKNTEDCYLKSEKRLLVALGIKGLVVVETSDAVLVANKKNSQEIKNIVEELKNKNHLEGTEHKKIYRPWGFFETLIEESFWKVKLIKVNPGESLSLQTHEFRSENWIVVSGTATVQVNEKKISLQKNQSISIPEGSMHRLTNKKSQDLKIIEVQVGSYLGEDDIKRFDDNYGRNKSNFN
tara:strand:+ start:250 stop:1737 length:1488 start_codon:yes stop_codon:yes gene_type:complete